MADVLLYLFFAALGGFVGWQVYLIERTEEWD